LTYALTVRLNDNSRSFLSFRVRELELRKLEPELGKPGDLGDVDIGGPPSRRV
jgi:hypothetical protein